MWVSYAGEFYSGVQNFWICLTAGKRLLSFKKQQADSAVQWNINKPACNLKLETKLRR
jgi:hypothetical protein